MPDKPMALPVLGAQGDHLHTTAYFLDGVRKLVLLREVPLEVFTPAHVQISIQSLGLSGGDLMYYETSAYYGRPLRTPIMIGKEAAGKLTALGGNVRLNWPDLAVGSRVVIEPSIPCRLCQKCVLGKYNVCVNMRTAAFAGREPYVHGFLREYVNWPSELVHM